MANTYASTKRAIAECDVCGFRYKLKQLKKLVVKGRTTEVKACPECWEKDHPQLHLGEMPIYDPQAIRDPRPDSSGYAQSRSQIIPISTVNATIFVRSLSVTIS